MKLTTAPAALVASAVMSAGTVTTGGVVSTTVTLKASLVLLPAASVAVQVTDVVPSGNVLPDAGEQSGVIVAVDDVDGRRREADVSAGGAGRLGLNVGGDDQSRSRRVDDLDGETAHRGISCGISCRALDRLSFRAGTCCPDSHVQMGVTGPSTRSVAVAANVAAAPAGLVASRT